MVAERVSAYVSVAPVLYASLIESVCVHTTISKSSSNNTQLWITVLDELIVVTSNPEKYLVPTAS